jgi:hypothetical protein
VKKAIDPNIIMRAMVGAGIPRSGTFAGSRIVMTENP